MSTISKDVIYLRNLHLSAVVGDDAWGRSGKSQPVMLSLRLHRNTLLAGSSDDVLDTFSYGQMCKDVTAAVDGKNFHGLGAINSVVGQLAEAWAGESLECQALLPKGLLRVDGGFGRKTVMRRYGPNEWRLLSSQWTVQKIKAACIIGVNSHERLYKQAVSIDVRVPNKEDDLEFDPCSVENHKTWRTVAHETLQVIGSYLGHFLAGLELR